MYTVSSKRFWKEDWISWSVAGCSEKIPEGSYMWFQKDRSPEVFRSYIETAVPRPPPLTSSHRLLYSLDFGHSRLFSASFGHLRAHFGPVHLVHQPDSLRATCASLCSHIKSYHHIRQQIVVIRMYLLLKPFDATTCSWGSCLSRALNKNFSCVS